MFKKFPGFDIWRLADKGAQINASTSTDRTEFHCCIPSDILLEALSLEALRLEKAPLTGLKTEAVVVRNEFERGRNNSANVLREEVVRIALDEKSTIGPMHDIENIINHEDDLRAFFKKFYVCANAAIVVSGSFDPEEVLAHIDAKFGHLPPGESTREGNATDQLEVTLPQRGTRSVDCAAEMPIGTLSFRVADGVTREGVAMELVAMWMNSAAAGPFGPMIEADPELHGVEADFSRVHGNSLFTVWIMPVSGGDASSRVDRLQRQILEQLVATRAMGMTAGKLGDLKKTLHRAWDAEVNTPSGYTAAVVESFARSNAPFDVAQRHHVLESLELSDIRSAWRKTFVLYRLTVGRGLPELMQVELAEPKFVAYSADGGIAPPIQAAPRKVVPFDDVVVTDSGVYLLDTTSPQVCVRVHVPTTDADNAEATLRAALVTLGAKMDDGTVVKESQLHEEISEMGASASVTGNHTGLDVRLDVRADENVGRLVELLKSGIARPAASHAAFERKQHFLAEGAVGGDYDVTESARRLFSRCLYHDAGDPRRMRTGVEESAELRGIRRDAALRGLSALGDKGAWVTCVAPTNAHLRLVRDAFEQGEAQHDSSVRPPGVGPHAGKVTTMSMPGKTSATMILGCASAVGPADDAALPLSLAVSALGSGFGSRLMQEVREKRGTFWPTLLSLLFSSSNSFSRNAP